MNTCISCGKTISSEDLSFRALEVRTLPIRDLKGEHKVQALGNFTDHSVCRDCAVKQLEMEKNPMQAVKKQLVMFGSILLVGIALLAVSLVLLDSERIYLVLAFAAIAGGILGLIGALRDGRERKEELDKLSATDQLEEAAWSLVVKNAPSKEGDNDLTYIPITERTLKRKNGDLMILYHLLPEIANEAYDRIHE